MRIWVADKDGPKSKFCKAYDRMRCTVLFTIHSSRDMIKLLEVHHFTLVLQILAAETTKIYRGKGSLSMPTKRFLFCCSYSRKTPSSTSSHNGASSAFLTGTCDKHVSDEQCIDMLLATGGVLQLYRKAGRNRDFKRSLTNRTYFQCRAVDAAVDAGLNKGRL